MFYLTVALIFCMQLTDERVEWVAFPASLGRDVSILWYSVHNAKGMPARLPLWLKRFSSFWTVSSVNLSFSCNHLPEICFISPARLTGLAQLRLQSFFRDRQATRKHRRFTCTWGLWLFGAYITLRSCPYVAFMAHALSTQSGSDRNKHTSQPFFQIIYSIWKGC